MHRPTLQTERLLLRPFALTDAKAVQLLAGDRDVASTTRLVPHPYEDGMAEEWIGTHQEAFERHEIVNFAVVLRHDDTLIGAIGLTLHLQDENAELGYWIGKPYWKQGYATEAARAVVRYGFEALNLQRVYAHCMKRNPASARVLEKIGMSCEGCLRQHYKKWGQFEDVENYGILRADHS